MSILANDALAAPSAAALAPATDRIRFAGIDALRGLAAMAVVLHHLMLAVNDKNGDVIPWLTVLGEWGRFGVEVFFVLSGFVIAHSTRNGAYSMRYLGRFAARRAIRLDVPYWATIAAEVLVLMLVARLMPQYAHPLPSVAQSAANMFYVQTFLGYQHILPVFWTLCYEVQFYLVFVLSLIALQRLAEWHSSVSFQRLCATLLLVLSFAVSLATYASLLPMPLEGLFIDRWFQFLLGAIGYLYVRGDVRSSSLIIAIVTCLCATLVAADAYRATSIAVCCATICLIIVSIRNDRFAAISAAPLLQWLGLLSYSLYLLHLVVGWRAVVLFKTIFPIDGVPLLGAAALGVGITVTVVASWLMNKALEAPAMRLAHRITLPRTHR